MISVICVNLKKKTKNKPLFEVKPSMAIILPLKRGKVFREVPGSLQSSEEQSVLTEAQAVGGWVDVTWIPG